MEASDQEPGTRVLGLGLFFTIPQYSSEGAVAAAAAAAVVVVIVVVVVVVVFVLSLFPPSF